MKLERKVKYITTVGPSGQPETHMIFENMGRFKKKKTITETKNINGKVITTVTNYEK